jgi:hypothetical protein
LPPPLSARSTGVLLEPASSLPESQSSKDRKKKEKKDRKVCVNHSR